MSDAHGFDRSSSHSEGMLVEYPTATCPTCGSAEQSHRRLPSSNRGDFNRCTDAWHDDKTTMSDVQEALAERVRGGFEHYGTADCDRALDELVEMVDALRAQNADWRVGYAQEFPGMGDPALLRKQRDEFGERIAKQDTVVEAMADAMRQTVLCRSCAHAKEDTPEECGGYRDGKRIPGWPCQYAPFRAFLAALDRKDEK